MRVAISPRYRLGMQVLGVILSVGFAAHAQTPSPNPSLESEFFKNILKDQKAIWTGPFRLERKDTKWLIAGGVGFGALITTDRITGDEIAEFDRGIKTSRIVSEAGSTYGVAAVAASLYIFGRSKGNTRARETGILAAQAAIDSVLVSSALKITSQRARPSAIRERSEFFDGGSSFPSGHSIQAWSVATVIAHEYHDNHKVQVAAYGLASVVSVARFTAGKHYISDVLVGSALGYAIGRYVYRAHHRDEDDSASDEKSESSASKWPQISPRYNRAAREFGVGLHWSF